MAFDQYSYQNNYNKKHYKRLTVIIPIEDEENLKKYWKNKGFKSFNVYVNELIRRDMKEENEKEYNIRETENQEDATIALIKEEIRNVIDTALRNANIKDVTVIVGDLSKTNAMTNAAGSISGNISISCGSVRDSVPIKKTITLSDAEKVSAAKEVIKKALAEITATNQIG